jgi:hypothetical protein
VGTFSDASSLSLDGLGAFFLVAFFFLVPFEKRRALIQQRSREQTNRERERLRERETERERGERERETFFGGMTDVQTVF